MDIQIGTAVCSKAGRDKGRFFAVMSCAGEYVMIADGDLRKLEKPKKKKLKHLSVTNTIFDLDALSSDKKLQKAILSRFSGGLSAKKEA